jgi:hypothetical protein
MSERTDEDFISDIREALQRSTTYVAGMTYAEFVVDTKTQDAVIRNLEILGEATKNLSQERRAKYPAVALEISFKRTPLPRCTSARPAPYIADNAQRCAAVAAARAKPTTTRETLQ